MSRSSHYSKFLQACSLEVFERELDEYVRNLANRRKAIKDVLNASFKREIPHESPANHSILLLIKQCDWDEEDLPLLQKVDNYLLTLLSTDSEMIEPVLEFLLEDAGIYSCIERKSYITLGSATLRVIPERMKVELCKQLP